MSKHLIVIVGPTAIGKTDLSIKLAQHFNTEILSADSRQFFKELNIGTAVPTVQELDTVKHHFIHTKSVEERYSVGDFEQDALKTLDTLFEKHEHVILVGGSGLYVDAVVNGLDEFPRVDPSIREELNASHQEEGLTNLQLRLKQLDRESYDTIDIDNPHRVIRALEICIGTNKPYSSYLKKKQTQRPFSTLYIGIQAERNVVYNRINKRVDQMIAHGLLEEVKALQQYKNLNALNTVGYKELFAYYDGALSLEDAIEAIKKNTRRFAKRQLTWYRKNKDIHWVDYNYQLNDVLQLINEKTKKPH